MAWTLKACGGYLAAFGGAWLLFHLLLLFVGDALSTYILLLAAPLGINFILSAGFSTTRGIISACVATGIVVFITLCLAASSEIGQGGLGGSAWIGLMLGIPGATGAWWLVVLMCYKRPKSRDQQQMPPKPRIR